MSRYVPQNYPQSATGNLSADEGRSSHHGILQRSRRGMALLMVLLMLSLTVGLCYAAVRSRFTASVIQRNADRLASARQAALTGMTLGLKKIHSSDWSGVNTSLSGALGKNESYLLTFTAGDSRLAADDPEQPYRVTLLSKGYAADPDNPASIAIYQIRAVVRLIPRRLAPQPSDWVRMQNFTVFQTRREDVEIDIPCRFTGPAKFQKKLRIARNYPNYNSARTRYLSDLNQMRLNGQGDYRPFTGPVYLPKSEQETTYYNLLVNSGAEIVDSLSQEAVTDWTKPSTLISYRIYPGGPQYTVQPLPDSLQSTTLQPDTAVNPLGIFYRDGSLTLNSDVTIVGSVFCRDEVRFSGTNIVIQPVALPPLHGTSSPLRLAAISSQNTTVKAGGGGQVTGLLAVFDTFLIEKGSEKMTFSLAGRLVTRRLFIKERSQWDTLDWEAYYNYFLLQLTWPPAYSEPYFPKLMAQFERSPVPKLVFQPENTAVTYHWANSYNPIFVPHPDDGGLRWNLLSWSEGQ